MPEIPSASGAATANAFARTLLLRMFEAAIACAQPGNFIRKYLPERPRGRLIVIGAGKAAGSMAAAVEQAWDGPLGGVVVTRYGYKVPTKRIAVLEAMHPVPDRNSVEASEAILGAISGLSPEDLVLALISGGGSALLCAPAEGVSLADKQALNKILLASGAPIQAMNCIRKHVSRVKGGRIARTAAPARLVSLLMSDIPGDDISAIASGPTVADPTTLEMARDFVARFRMDLPPSLIRALQDPANETPKPGDACFERCENHLVMKPGLALEAAAQTARQAGFEVLLLGDALEGEAAELGRDHAEIAIKTAREGRCLCILSGGETTVTLRHKGKGGRNTEYLLSLALHLKGEPGVFALAGDTDGVDGSEDNAGASIAPDTWSRAEALGVDLAAHLEKNDAYTAFSKLGDLVVTGPTMTNVNDFRAILILPDRA